MPVTSPIVPVKAHTGASIARTEAEFALIENSIAHIEDTTDSTEIVIAHVVLF